VLAARHLQPDLSFADVYMPVTMSDELINAHHALDRAVDQLFGLESQHPSELERHNVLCTRYREMAPPLLAGMTYGRKRR